MKGENAEPYESPELVRYGNLESVTDGMQGSGVDDQGQRGMPVMSKNRKRWY